jgi:8-oxo-dGTP pyrophosphatase MutT (NUDIX family)
MKRQPLIQLLTEYQRRYPQDKDRVQRVLSFVERRPDCFERTCLEGHITASAWILSPDRKNFLLTHHRKLSRWLQLGGHADGDSRVDQVALREAQEESGMHNFVFYDEESRRIPIDVDIHEIPARGNEPCHWHYDIRYCLVAEPGQELVVSDESHDLRWFAMNQLEEVASEESLLRMGGRVRDQLINTVDDKMRPKPC